MAAAVRRPLPLDVQFCWCVPTPYLITRGGKKGSLMGHTLSTRRFYLGFIWNEIMVKVRCIKNYANIPVLLPLFKSFSITQLEFVDRYFFLLQFFFQGKNCSF